MKARLAPTAPVIRRAPPPERPDRRPADPRPAPLIKPTGPLVYTVSKGADVFPSSRKG